MKNSLRWISMGSRPKKFQFSTIFTNRVKTVIFKGKNVRSGKRSGLTTFLCKWKILCVGFWREIGPKIFKFRQFLLIDLKWPIFTNFGRLFLKKIHSGSNFSSFHIKVLDIPVVYAKYEKNPYVWTPLNLPPKMGLKTKVFTHLP